MRFTNYEPSIIKIYNKDRCLVAEELSLMAVVPKSNNSILAIGKEAKEIPDTKITINDTILIGSPLRNGAIAEFDLSLAMFKYFFMLPKVKLFRRILKPKIAVCIPAEVTQVETRALQEVMMLLGARGILIFDKPYSAVAQDISSKYDAVIEILPIVHLHENGLVSSVGCAVSGAFCAPTESDFQVDSLYK